MVTFELLGEAGLVSQSVQTRQLDGTAETADEGWHRVRLGFPFTLVENEFRIGANLRTQVSAKRMFEAFDESKRKTQAGPAPGFFRRFGRLAV